MGWNKKGELTTQQLVVIIIIIISFVIILFLLWRLNLGEETQKEICHNSVVMVGKGFGELDCRTNYVCISKGEDCKEFNPTTTVDVKNEEEIVNAIQKEIDDCDWMFGEGKINYVSSKVPLIGIEIPTLHYYCAVCSIIKFDEKIQKEYEDKDLIFNNAIISTDEKYSVFTGMDADFGTDDYFLANITKLSEIGSTYCNKYLHKA